MAIIDDYDAIAKRMRELGCQTPKSVEAMTDLEQWQNSALDVARSYVEQRRREAAAKRVFRRVPLPTD